METILKKLDLEDILEKELHFWCETTMTVNLFDTNMDEASASNVFSKVSENALTNKISETIQNIKIKKQNNFYVSQKVRKDGKKSKTNATKIKKKITNTPKEYHTEEDFNEDSNEEDIFVNNSRKTCSNISLKSLLPSTYFTPPDSSTISSSSSSVKVISETLRSSSHAQLDTEKLAKLKLSAFKFNKKQSNLNSNKVDKTTTESTSHPQQSCISNIFLSDDEDDLSYLDID